MILIEDTNRLRIEFSKLDNRIYVYQNGQYVGNELLTELVRHLLDEDKHTDYQREEMGHDKEG